MKELKTGTAYTVFLLNDLGTWNQPCVRFKRRGWTEESAAEFLKSKWDAFIHFSFEEDRYGFDNELYQEFQEDPKEWV